MTDLPRLLSAKPIPARERLIVALDVPGFDEALALVKTLGDSVCFYKLGLELFMADRYFELVEELASLGKRIFVDLKFFDIPATVAAAVRQLARRGADFATVHGNESMIEAACAEKGALKLLAVTVLTSIDQSDFSDLGVEVEHHRDAVLCPEPHELLYAHLARKALHAEVALVDF